MSSEPIHVIQFGLVKCEIFRHQTRSGERFNATVTRLYRDGVWKQSKQFGRDDLPLVSKATDQAHTWIFQQAHTNGSGVPAEPAS